MINLADPGSPEAVTPDDFLKLVVDRRSFHAPSYITEKNGVKKRVSYTPQTRKWIETTGVCLHQTACDMGERVERYDTMGAHWGVLRSGTIVKLCDSNRIVYHGNGWNNRTIGIEVNGLYAGREDDPKTAVDEALQSTWNDPSTPYRETPQKVTALAMASLRMLLRFLHYEIAQNGGHMQFLVAHRQSSTDRRNDPGESIWRQAALPIMDELGLTSGTQGFTIGGYPIPECWGQPDAKGTPY